MLGIDVSKDTLVCNLLDPNTRKSRWERTLPNTSQGILQLLKQTPAETPWVLEPTGRYSLPVVKQARAAGRQVLLAPPRKAQAYLRSIQTRAKTDRLDSYGLGLFALSVPLAPYPVKSDAVERLDQLLAARKGIAEAMTALRLRIAELPHAAVPLTKAVAELEAQRDALEREISQLTADHAEFAPVGELLKVPGIGRVTAAAAVSRLQAKQFSHPDQFVAYIGLDVAIRQSGKRKGERGLTKEGDAELRRLFYCCAQASLRAKESPFAAQYERELKKGLPPTAALCAVARKMARLCWSLFHHQSQYDPKRIYRQG